MMCRYSPGDQADDELLLLAKTRGTLRRRRGEIGRRTAEDNLFVPVGSAAFSMNYRHEQRNEGVYN